MKNALAADALEHRQLPRPLLDVVPDDAHVAVGRPHLEVPMIGREPLVDDIVDVEGTVIELEAPRRLLAAIAGVAFDGDVEWLH